MSEQRIAAREKLSRLLQNQLQDLSTDVYDELNRRTDGAQGNLGQKATNGVEFNNSKEGSTSWDDGMHGMMVQWRTVMGFVGWWQTRMHLDLSKNQKKKKNALAMMVRDTLLTSI